MADKRQESVHLEMASNMQVEESRDQPKQLDTVHNDEAVKVLAAYDGDDAWSDDEAKRLVRKIDKRLLPILFVTFGLQFYDKVILAHAALFGIMKDLDLLVHGRFSMASSIFYLGFMAGSYPAMFLAQRFHVPHVITGIVALWGICALAGAGCTNWQGLYAQRFFLGFLESGVPPIFMMIVGSWYTKAEQVFRMGIWTAAGPVASALAPLINYGLGHIKGSLATWRYMFIFAGSITVLWALVIFLCMDADPVSARHLSEREKFIAVSRLRSNNTGIRNAHFKRSQAFEALTSLQFWLLFSISVCVNLSLALPLTFTPLIIAGMGFSGLNALLLTIPSGVFGTISVLLFAYWLQRVSSKNWRTYVISALVAWMIIACCINWRLPHLAAAGRLFWIYMLGVYPTIYALLMSLSIANAAGYTKRSVFSTGLFIAYCVGNFAGPFAFLQHQRPIYTTAWLVITVCLAVSIVLTLTYRFVCMRINRQRTEAGQAENFEHAYEDDVTDKKNPGFRYIY